jgi:restriction system protein
MNLTNKKPQDWKDLQNKVAEILNECGFNVKIEMDVETVRGKVEIDVYAEEIIMGRKYSIAFECKNWKARIPQNIVHGFRTVINDLGCNIGYIITTSDFQSGSIVTTKYTNVELLTWETFLSTFLESWLNSYFNPQLEKFWIMVQMAKFNHFTLKLPKKMSKKDLNEYNILIDRFLDFREFAMCYANGAVAKEWYGKNIFPAYEWLKGGTIPIDILKETGYREFLEKCQLYLNVMISENEQLICKYKK